MRSPIDALRDEHRVIVQMLAALETAATRAGTERQPPDRWWDRAIDWLSAFADRSHHAKEEHVLFPAMIETGVPSEDGPIAVVLEEHARGRGLIHAMAAGTPSERAASAVEYVRLLRDHIDKEDGFVFPLADAVLDERAQAAVGRAFETVELEQGRAASLVDAEVVVRELTAALG